MTRGHRSVHRLLWIAIALVVSVGFTMALLLRAPAHAAEPSLGFVEVVR